MIEPYEIGEHHGLEVLDKNVKAGLDTLDINERLNALRNANRIDLVKGTSFGPQVVARFAEQAGYRFQPSSSPSRTVDVTRKRPLDAQIEVELARAIGVRFGIETLILELVSVETQDFVMAYPGQGDTYLNGIASSQKFFRANTEQQKKMFLPVDYDRPYLLMQRFNSNMSRYNYGRALLGLRGTISR